MLLVGRLLIISFVQVVEVQLVIVILQVAATITMAESIK